MKLALFILFFFPFVLKAQKVETSSKPVRNQTVLNSIDQQPEFEGGIPAWRNFLMKNLDPSRAAEAQDSLSFAKFGTRQMAIVRFTVCDDGSLCDFEVVNKQKVSPAVAQEALKVMKKSPSWIPAKSKGMNVKAAFQQPIIFSFED
ncbi:energy transducer TonB [Pedobacter punctiformis]|uniref:TonB C-terminal domain-containing protein n=1 Tax=Pedobacter punctiformis TaxID=3004097 RepID=A0ABT4L9L4_9SPHI|nr:hypothetical protein [Pedobacter sp. HCMS5-2]MCZ4244614.1 hypothetical protein [Pedobacter sp. HCMS5-2]